MKSSSSSFWDDPVGTSALPNLSSSNAVNPANGQPRGDPHQREQGEATTVEPKGGQEARVSGSSSGTFWRGSRSSSSTHVGDDPTEVWPGSSEQGMRECSDALW
jgi:hypothetical protein